MYIYIYISTNKECNTYIAIVMMRRMGVLDCFHDFPGYLHSDDEVV